MFPNRSCLLCEPLEIWWLQPWQFWSPVPGSGSSFVIQLWAKRIALVWRKWWIWGIQIWSNPSSPVKRGGRKALALPPLLYSGASHPLAPDFVAYLKSIYGQVTKVVNVIFTQMTNLSKCLWLPSSLPHSGNLGIQRKDCCSHLPLQPRVSMKVAGESTQACLPCSALIHGGPINLVPYAVCCYHLTWEVEPACLSPLATLPQGIQGEPSLAAGSLPKAHNYQGTSSAKCMPGPQILSPLTILINPECFQLAPVFYMNCMQGFVFECMCD